MKILIVDDEITSRLKADKLVSGLGHETLVAENGETAWETWQHERPRVIITDWMMPEMTGVELCSRIRNAEGDQYSYIIMITSKDSPDDLETAMQYGVDDFIAKPFRKQELAARLRPAQRTIQLQTRDIVIFSMAKLAESRDPETGNHLERIRHYSKTLAQTLKADQVFADELDESFIENIFQTSPLHDIGKVGIPDHVLLKPDRLDDSEFETMKTHTIIGHNTLKDAFSRYPEAEYLQMSADIALSHHEKYNGSGYPNGISGNAIPLSARIVAVADVYDALVSKRVYKQALSTDIARSIIVKEKGEHFDPLVVDAFLGCEQDFIEICLKFKA
jgi:putative two-component system response regulator